MSQSRTKQIAFICFPFSNFKNLFPCNCSGNLSLVIIALFVIRNLRFFSLPRRNSSNSNKTKWESMLIVIFNLEIGGDESTVQPISMLIWLWKCFGPYDERYWTHSATALSSIHQFLFRIRWTEASCQVKIYSDVKSSCNHCWHVKDSQHLLMRWSRCWTC